MDQPRIERLLRLMKMLSSNVNYTVEELANKFDVSIRTMYRYIDTLKTSGFELTRYPGNVYKIGKMSKQDEKELEQLNQELNQELSEYAREHEGDMGKDKKTQPKRKKKKGKLWKKILVVLLDVYLGYEGKTEKIFEEERDWAGQIGKISELSFFVSIVCIRLGGRELSRPYWG